MSNNLLFCFLQEALNLANVQSWVEQAIEEVYRHFDTAYLYRTEVAVGKAVRAKIDAGLIKRQDVFITSKVQLLVRNRKCNITHFKMHKNVLHSRAIVL